MEFTERHVEGLKELLYKMADDLLIIGHRNSEWTGLGPMLEEDIAFSSMAQDKIGQSLALFELLHELGESDPDTVAFTRNAPQFHCSQLVELPIGGYDFSMVRHFFFDHAEAIRFEMLTETVLNLWRWWPRSSRAKSSITRCMLIFSCRNWQRVVRRVSHECKMPSTIRLVWLWECLNRELMKRN